MILLGNLLSWVMRRLAASSFLRFLCFLCCLRSSPFTYIIYIPCITYVSYHLLTLLTWQALLISGLTFLTFFTFPAIYLLTLPPCVTFVSYHLPTLLTWYMACITYHWSLLTSLRCRRVNALFFLAIRKANLERDPMKRETNLCDSFERFFKLQFRV